MIQYIKAKDSKGLKKVILSDLGRINVICGKNNSGKSSLLEALSAEDKKALGRKVTESDLEWLLSTFRKHTDQYNEPVKTKINSWFLSYFKEIINTNIVWFTDEREIIKSKISESKNNPLKSYNLNFGSLYDTILSSFFKGQENFYKPFLIPPKRTLETSISINTSSKIEPNGVGLTNKLFYLKNQDLRSKEYKTYENIYRHFHDVTGYYFNIFLKDDNTLQICFQEKDKQWINADSCGLGLSDALVMITFILAFDEYTFYLIEEPESHLHPDMQKRFLKFVNDIKSKQFFFSTHSSVFLNPNITNKIFYTEFKDEVKVSDQTSKSAILYNLGYSVADNLVSDVIIFTEGPSDQPVIATILEWLGLSDKYNIRYWSLGGDIMAESDISVFAQSKNVFALIDKDPGSSVSRTRFQKRCDTEGVSCTRLERYALENYFTIEAIKKSFPTITKPITELNPNEKVDKQLFDDNKSIKNKNQEIINHMSLEDLKDTDLLRFCESVKKYCEENIPLAIN